MGGVRTSVGGGSRGKLGIGADVASNCWCGPDLLLCRSPFPMGGRGGAMRQRRIGYGTYMACDN